MTIYWDSRNGGDFSLVPEGWDVENITPLRQVATATTWGEVKAVSKPDWLQLILESHIDGRVGAGDEISDATPFLVADLGMDAGSLLDYMVAPWDLESLLDWFPDEDMDVIEVNCRIGGASPGGHIDVYTPRDESALIAALRSRGYNVAQRGFLSDLEQALEQFSARAKPSEYAPKKP
jgi:hypothetical protein